MSSSQAGTHCLSVNFKSSQPNSRKELCLSWTTSGTITEKDKDYIQPIPPAPDCLELTESSSLPPTTMPMLTVVEPEEEEVLIHYSQLEEESSQDINQEYLLNWSSIAATLAHRPEKEVWLLVDTLQKFSRL